jgi:hypothetical protein
MTLLTSVEAILGGAAAAYCSISAGDPIGTKMTALTSGYSRAIYNNRSARPFSGQSMFGRDPISRSSPRCAVAEEKRAKD